MRVFGPRNPYVPWLNIASSFALGALLTWALAEAVQRRKMEPAPPGDDVVLERVRDRVFQIVSHPDSVHVSVENGVVRLSGEVPAAERDELLAQLVHMPGVVRLRNKLAAVRAVHG